MQSSAPACHPIQVFAWEDGACVILDQTQLPHSERYVKCREFQEIVAHIKTLAIRGAPAIGVAGAYGVVLAAKQALDLPVPHRREFLETAVEKLSEARPTAVNLKWATNRMRDVWRAEDFAVTDATVARLLAEVEAIREEEANANRQLAAYGAELLTTGPVLTYCNTGSLATGAAGTALAVAIESFRRGITSHVYVCETRPLLQGLRLTAWELTRAVVPFTVVCDNMAATVLKQRRVAAVLVGADRIAANGDTANKIGTYGLAILAKYHGIPFYVVAPSSTIDADTASGAEIPIEERAPGEIVNVIGKGNFAPPAYNPAFDVTPRDLITAFVSENGVKRGTTYHD